MLKTLPEQINQTAKESIFQHSHWRMPIVNLEYFSLDRPNPLMYFRYSVTDTLTIPMDIGAEPKSSKINPERIRKSSAYRAALARATKVLKKPEKLTNLINDATHKAGTLNKGPIAEARDSLFALFRLLKAYSNGDYRDLSWSNLVLVVGAILYFVMPIDLLPDIIVGLGYLDDAAIITWTINSLGQELERFKRWETSHPAQPRRSVEMAED